MVVAGPDWAGEAPAGVTLYRSTTNLAWAILRIQVDDGLDGISELQDGFGSRRCPTRGTTATPPSLSAHVRPRTSARRWMP